MESRRVLLIQPMHEKLDRSARQSINFPWGLAYVATALRRAGFAVKVLDGQRLQMPKEELAEQVDASAYDIYGLTGFSTQYPALKLLAHTIRARTDAPILAGGPAATYQPELILRNTAIDVLILGEGEITVVDLLAKMDRLAEVPGIAYRRDGEVVINPPREERVNLDANPLPDFDLFDMPAYLRSNQSFSRAEASGNSLAVITSRGCPYACNFCSKSSRRYTAMSPAVIASALTELKDRFDLSQVNFNDELFLANKARFQELAPTLRALGLEWGGQARVNLVDEELLRLVRESGGTGVGYGIESGSPTILKNMNKQITPEQIETALRSTERLGLKMKIQLIFGYPGETEETLAETIELFRRVDHPGRRFNVIVPVPGSPLYRQCLAEGKITDEEAYLSEIEKSFGWGKVHVNFTPWPDDEIYPRKEAAEEAMRRNYINNSLWRRGRHALSRVRSLLPR